MQPPPAQAIAIALALCRQVLTMHRTTMMLAAAALLLLPAASAESLANDTDAHLVVGCERLPGPLAAACGAAASRLDGACAALPGPLAVACGALA